MKRAYNGRYWSGAPSHGALVDVYTDGTILIYVTGVELGQGLYTKCAQVAALTLGLEDTRCAIND